MYSDIRYEIDDPVATITLDRPESLNAMTPRMTSELRAAVGEAVDDRSVVGIVITGAGRAFCAGADLRAAREHEPVETARAEAGATRNDTLFDGPYSFLLASPKPVVAAINGPAAGVAVCLALCCDLRFASQDAFITTAFAERGFVAEHGLSWLLPRLVGTSRAIDLLISSRRVGSDEALAIGLIDRVSPPGEVVAHARDYVVDLARRCSPASMAVMKSQVYAELHAGLAASEAAAAARMIEAAARPDAAEGVRAFLERRPAAFPRIGRTGDDHGADATARVG